MITISFLISFLRCFRLISSWYLCIHAFYNRDSYFTDPLFTVLLGITLNMIIVENLRYVLFSRFIGYILFTRPSSCSYSATSPGFPSGRSVGLVGFILITERYRRTKGLTVFHKAICLLLCFSYFIIAIYQFIIKPDHTLLQIFLTVPFATYYYKKLSQLVGKLLSKIKNPFFRLLLSASVLIIPSELYFLQVINIKNYVQRRLGF